MIEFLRKINWGVIVLWGLLFVGINTPFAFAGEKLPPEKAYLKDVFQNMMAISSLHYDITIKADTPMGEMKAAINGEAQEKPLSAKHDMHLSFYDVLNKENTVIVKQYMEESQGNLVVYSFSNDTWIKQIMPFDSSLTKEPSADEKAAAQTNMLQLIKDAKQIKETPSFKYMEITLDSVQLSDAMSAAIKQNQTNDKDMAAAAAMGRLALLAAGDIKYTIKVDKATKVVKELEIDLTEPIRKGAGLFLDIANPKDRTTIEDFLTKSTLTMQVTYSKYNQVDPIEIPKDVKDNAKEVKSADLAKPNKSKAAITSL